MVVASPVEDYFLYIDDLTYPNKVRLWSALLYDIFSKRISCFYFSDINGRKKLRKLRNQFWMLLVKSILFIAKVLIFIKILPIKKIYKRKNRLEARRQ